MTREGTLLRGAWLSGVAFFGLATAVFSFAHYVPDRVVTETLDLEFQSSAGQHGRVLFKKGGTVTASEVLDYGLAEPTNPTERQIEVTIDPGGRSRAPGGSGSQIWIGKVRTDVAGTPNWGQITLPAGWRVLTEEFTQSSMLVNDGTTSEAIDFHVPTRNGTLGIWFYATPRAGRARVAVGGVTIEELDTYAERPAFRLVNLKAPPGFEQTSRLRIPVQRGDASTLRFEVADRIGRFRLEGLGLSGSRHYRWDPTKPPPRLGPGAKLVKSSGTDLQIAVLDPASAWIEFTDLPFEDAFFGIQRRAILVGLEMLVIGSTLALVSRLVLPILRGRRGAMLVGVPMLAGSFLVISLPWSNSASTDVRMRDESENFTLTAWPQKFENPVGLAFEDEGAGFVIEKGGWNGRSQGKVWRVSADAGPPSLMLEVDVCTDAERGLLGVALDPAYSENRYIYLYYTNPSQGECPISSRSPVANRVSRFTVDGDRIDPSSEVVLLDGIPASSSAHNGGGVRFGSDGSLFISTGEGTSGNNSQDLSSLGGKILRIMPDPGAVVPADNPFSEASGNARFVWALGLRNPFRFDIRPKDGLTLIGDVGSDPPEAVEEINLGVAGSNFGWPEVEGQGAGDGKFVDPIYTYEHDSECNTVIGGAFVESEVYGPDLEGALIFTDFSCSHVKALEVDGSTLVSVTTLISPNEDHQFVHVERGKNGLIHLVDIRGSVFELKRR